MNKQLGLIKRLFVLAILLVAVYRIDALEKQVTELKAKPAIVYHVDNAGGAMIGKVTGKAIVDGKYTLDCGVYGKFLATNELYDSVNVGDENYNNRAGAILTSQKKYNVDNPMQCEEIQLKAIQGCIDKFGVENRGQLS